MAFDEAGYLAANPDVAAAVASGDFASGAQHYQMYGASEGRAADGVVASPGASTSPVPDPSGQPNWASGAGYATNITAAPGTPAYYSQLNDAMAAYRAGVGVNPATGLTAAQEAGTFWNTGSGMRNYLEANPDVMMNYIVNAGKAGVDPQQYALSHFDMTTANSEGGRQGVLPTGQTNIERITGRSGGTLYDIFGEPGFFPSISRGITTPAADLAKYQQMFGSQMGNVGPFAGLETAQQRAALAPQLTAAFNNLTANSTGVKSVGGGTTPITSGMFSGTTSGGLTGTNTQPPVNFNQPDGSYQPNKTSAGGTSGNYYDQLDNYYKAYYGEGSAPNRSFLTSWYGGQYAPTPTGFASNNKGTSAARSIINSLNWDSPAATEQSVKKLDEYRRVYGLSTKDIADAMGVSESDVIAQFSKYGISLPVVSTTTGANTSTQDTTTSQGGA